MGQSELTARGQMLRRTKLFLENLTMGVLRFPFCLTLPFSRPLIGAVGQRPRAAQLGTEAEPRPAGTRLLSVKLCGHTRSASGARSRGIGPEAFVRSLVCPCGGTERPAFLPVPAFCSPSCDLVGGPPCSLEYLFAVPEYHKLT